jgi:hypothetical protein
MPGARVTLSTPQAIATGATPVQILFDTVIFAQAGAVRASGGVQVPSAGLYQVDANVLLNVNAPTGRIDFGVYNVTQNPSPTDVGAVCAGAVVFNHAAGLYQSIVASAVIQANANDVIGGMVGNQSGAPGVSGGIYGGSNWTSLSVVKVST